MRIKLFVAVSVSCLAFSGCAETHDPVDAEFPEESDFQRVKFNNPDATVDLGAGLWAWPLPMDFDGDGDMDLLVSTPDVPFSGLHYFENSSGEIFPAFEPPVRVSDAIRNVQISYAGNDFHVLIPGALLENFTSSFAENQVPIYPADSVLNGITRARFNQWKLVDFENDGDLDILAGVDDWGDYGWDNAYDDAGNWINGPLHGYSLSHRK